MEEKSYDVEMKESMLLVDHVPGIDTDIAILTVIPNMLTGTMIMVMMIVCGVCAGSE